MQYEFRRKKKKKKTRRIKKQDIEKKKRTQCERNSMHKQYAQPDTERRGVNLVFGQHGVFPSVFSLNWGENILMGLEGESTQTPSIFFPPLSLTKQPSKVFSLPFFFFFHPPQNPPNQMYPKDSFGLKRNEWREIEQSQLKIN